ncbi:glycosyltransferase involved in cell wall biosynthesis [Sphingomonas jejuensis]|uniref:Glycosyltransferase involved in cell wall biosynthesis n=1 Tax=Sphingomonas jejuensis TaxID=904715 RepID=A0ABX0XMJ8_9SPHN|nr:glycosyltransferase [Sphingomonas jejuensis]NJC34459.1 glycosyltransferase involved in cell wall biosynthesis [Sphingomonas jejuensis]
MPKLLMIHAGIGADPLDAVAVRLANGLADKAQVTLLAPAGVHPGAAAGAIGRKVAVEAGSGGSRPLLSALPALVQRLKRDRFDHVIATGNGVGWLAAAANIAAGRPSRLTIKVDRPLDAKGALTTRLQASVFAEAVRVLVPSDADRRLLARRFPAAASRFLAVAEPILPATGRSLPPPRHKGGRRRLVASGVVDKAARFDLLIDAVAAAASDVQLSVVGDGPDRDRLLARAAAAGIADRVEIVPGADLTPHLRDADLYLLAAAREAMPPHLIEALGHDRGVVSTDSFAAARDLLDGAPGCAVVRRDDPRLIAQAIDETLAAGPRPSLRPIAERHGVAAAVQAHAWAMGML